MDNQTTVIGASSHIKGTLEGDENLTVVGRVDGNIALTKSLFVDPNGVVVADVQVHTAIISGSVIGNIRASDLIHITEEGRVVGDLSAPRVILVDGASFKGGIDMGDLDAPPTARSATSSLMGRHDEREELKKPAPAPRQTRPPSRQEPLEQRAAAAAQAVTKAARAKTKAPAPTKRKTAANPAQKPTKKPTQKKRSAPVKPPTTAGKKSRARRK